MAKPAVLRASREGLRRRVPALQPGPGLPHGGESASRPGGVDHPGQRGAADQAPAAVSRSAPFRLEKESSQLKWVVVRDGLKRYLPTTQVTVKVRQPYGVSTVGAAEAAGHYVPDDDIDLPF